MIRIYIVLLSLFIFISCDQDGDPSQSLSITNGQYLNNQIILKGKGLNSADNANLRSQGSLISMRVVSKSETQLVLEPNQSGEIKLGSIVDLILANAYGQTTYPLSVTMDDNSIGLAQLDLVALDARYASSGGGAGELNCPNGFIKVPGDSFYQTQDFCIMKYEAKTTSQGVMSKPEGIPLRGMVSQIAAMNFCSNLGAGYRLINNAEWLTIAANIISVPGNWSSGNIGDGLLNRGHSDHSPSQLLPASSDDNDPCYLTGQTCDASTWNSQKRTHTLSNGESIWDFAGNAWEWVAWQVFEEKIGPSSSWRKISDFSSYDNTEQMKITDIRPTSTSHTFYNDEWNENQGLGRYKPFHQQAGGAALRGGSVYSGAYTGVLTLYLDLDSQAVDRMTGFRCVYSLK